MDSASLLVFAGTLFAAAITPGPGIAALVSYVLGYGMRNGLSFGLGMICGDSVLFTLAVLGVAAIAKTFAFAFFVLKIVGALYLVYLAWNLWRSGGFVSEQPRSMETKFWAAFTSGFTVTISNPKPIMFYMALMPNLISVEQVSLLAYGELLGIIAGVLLVVVFGYAALAARARSLMTSGKAVRRLNKGVSLAMIGAAAAIVTK
ncbi:LysE family translocator [Polycladidibacter hongkongensis]|uniref:LysE family translocator n=1 Tax=Polycladidibacter hongkongensis TaxID=1647556 RepID=UPI00082A8E0D|nr:LysE family translocator [Pseudovibrio hongkongensis]